MPAWHEVWGQCSGHMLLLCTPGHESERRLAQRTVRRTLGKCTLSWGTLVKRWAAVCCAIGGASGASAVESVWTYACGVEISLTLVYSAFGGGVGIDDVLEVEPELLPQPADVIARHVEAIGGEAAFLALRSRRASGTIELPEHGLRGMLTLLSAAPDRRLVELMIPEIGAFRQGYDGETAWSIDPIAGARVLEGREMEERIEDADFFADVRLHRPGTTMQTVGRVAFEGRACFKLRASKPSAPDSFLFFDVETGLLAGRVYQATFEGTPEMVTVVLDGYETIGGIKVPMRTRISSGGGIHLIELTEVEIDVVEPTVFVLPPEIEGIVQTRNAAGVERLPPGSVGPGPVEPGSVGPG